MSGSDSVSTPELRGIELERSTPFGYALRAAADEGRRNGFMGPKSSSTSGLPVSSCAESGSRVSGDETSGLLNGTAVLILREARAFSLAALLVDLDVGVIRTEGTVRAGASARVLAGVRLYVRAYVREGVRKGVVVADGNGAVAAGCNEVVAAVRDARDDGVAVYGGGKRSSAATSRAKSGTGAAGGGGVCM
jgi:hypothetical protein